jgi:hypothetical protein
MRSPRKNLALFAPALTALLSILGGCGSDSSADDGESAPDGDVEQGGGSGANHADAAATGGAGMVATGGTRATGGTNAAGGSHGTGGSNAAGGNAGSSGGGTGGHDAGPHVVGQCNALPAAGTWELISPPAWASSAKNEALGILVSPDTSGVVYAAAGDKTNGGTGGTGIYKSTDCGSTWAKVSTGTNGAALESGEAWDMAIDQHDGEILYTVNGYGSPASLFRSGNGGVDWTVLMPDGGTLANAIGGNFVQHFGVDPNDSNHVLVVFHFNCTGTYAPMCLAETTDGGANWRAFKGPTTGWDEGAGPPIVLGKTTWVYPSGSALYYTKDGGATWEKVFNDGTASHYVAQDGTIYLGGNYGLLHSTDGHAWTSISGAPKATAVIGDGTSLYTAFQNDYSGKPMYTALMGDLAKWTNMQTPTIRQGSHSLGYDADHKVLYGAFMGGGLFRYVVK